MRRLVNLTPFLLVAAFGNPILFAQLNYKIDSLLSVLKTAGEDTVKVNTLNHLSRQFRVERSDYAQAIQYAETALSLSEKIGYKAGMAYACNNIGFNYYMLGNYPGALKNHLLALKISKENGCNQQIAFAYTGIGGIYQDQGNWSEAFPNYLASLKIAEQIGDKKAVADGYQSIGSVYGLQGNDTEALKYYLTALRIKLEMKDSIGCYYTYEGIGEIYRKQGNYAEAMKNKLASLKLSEEFGIKDGISNFYGQSGVIYYDQGDYTRALKNYLVSAKMLAETGRIKGVARDYIFIGQVYIKLKKFAEARKFLNQALSRFKELASKEEIKDSYDELTRLDSATGNWKGAYQNHKLSVLYGDSLVDEKNSKRTIQTLMQYEFDKKEDSIKYQQSLTDAKLKLRENQLQSQRKQKLFYIGGLALMILVFILIFRNFKQRQRANAAIGEERLRTEQADAAHKISDLEMKALRSQMNPHFIFNSLNSIYNFIQLNNTGDASEYLVKFSKLMRLILENSRFNEVAVEKELEALRLYMELECVRMDHKFSFDIITGELDLENTMIPPLILQPFVENAIWHGMMNKEGTGKIIIRLTRENDMINCSVEDNGVGREMANMFKSKVSSDQHESLGVKLTHDRINIINLTKKAMASMVIVDLRDEAKNPIGTRVEVKLPLESRL